MRREYVVRKVRIGKNGKSKVYLEGKSIFNCYFTTDSSIKKYSIVIIINGRVVKASSVQKK